MVNRTLSNLEIRLDNWSEKLLQNNANKTRMVGEVALAPTLIALAIFQSATIRGALIRKRNLRLLSHLMDGAGFLGCFEDMSSRAPYLA